MARKASPIRASHVNDLAMELSEKAGITPAQAKRVLSLLHADKLVPHSKTLHKILKDPASVEALGMGNDRAAKSLRAASSDGLALKNLRVGVKPRGADVGMIV